VIRDRSRPATIVYGHDECMFRQSMHLPITPRLAFMEKKSDCVKEY
jgi:hypothetical protein